MFLILLTAGAVCAGAAIRSLHQDMLKEYMTKGAPTDFFLIDVRGPGEITEMIGNKACRPYNLVWPDEFKREAIKLPKDAMIVIYCRSGNRASGAVNFLQENGYTNVFNGGGMNTWEGPTIPPSAAKRADQLPAPSMRAQ